jgi:hypothetical protein
MMQLNDGGIDRLSEYLAKVSTRQAKLERINEQMEEVLHDLVENRCPSYGIVTSNLRGQMRLFVLALRSLMGEISDVYVNAENTGIGKVFANKVRVWATRVAMPLGLCKNSSSFDDVISSIVGRYYSNPRYYGYPSIFYDCSLSCARGGVLLP